MSGVRVRLFGQIIAGGNSPDEGVPRLGGRLLTADWALDLLPVVVAKIRIKKKHIAPLTLRQEICMSWMKKQLLFKAKIPILYAMTTITLVSRVCELGEVTAISISSHSK